MRTIWENLSVDAETENSMNQMQKEAVIIGLALEDFTSADQA